MLSITSPAMPMAISSTPTTKSGLMVAPCSLARLSPDVKRPMPREVPSGSHKKCTALVDGQTGHRLEVAVAGAADRMADHGEAIVRDAQHPAHHLRGADEARRHDAEGGNQETFSRY